MLRLHSYWRSSASYRVRIALGLKGLKFEHLTVNLLKNEQGQPEFTALNPEGLVPLLEHDGLRLSQSTAIIEYLEEAFPSPALMPTDLQGRARVRAICQMIACDIHPLNNLRVLKYLTGEMGLPAEQKDTWYAHWVRVGLGAVEKRLAEAASGQFCHGDLPGMADCFLVPQVANANRMNVDIAHLKRVAEINARCMELPAFQQAQPSACPDAVSS
jgi:maleylacetoacetate isomerase/maleylpyruvate isomerase